jgi:hypothetical protein
MSGTMRPVAAAIPPPEDASELPPPWPNLGQATSLHKIMMRRAEPRAGHHKGGTWCDLQKRHVE